MHIYIYQYIYIYIFVYVKKWPCEYTKNDGQHLDPAKKNWQTPHGRCQKSVVLGVQSGPIQDYTHLSTPW
jgi:hypothetical protein